MTTSVNDSASLDARFRDAVSAIDAGDVDAVERLVAADPALVRERLASPGAWLRDAVGNALDGFFREPYLLWFVAEDPVRRGTLPANIAEVARTIVAAARRESPGNLQEQLDYALSLVAWSWIARQEGVQLDLIDALVDAGASPAGNAANALVNGNFAAAARLVERGAELTLDVAACLGYWNDVERLLPTSSGAEKQLALVLSALQGQVDAVQRLLGAGADPNVPSATLYSHGTPLHHAVASGQLAAVRALAEAGADHRARDAAWNGTPLGWAEYYLGGAREAEAGTQYAEIAAYLRSRGG